jgi:hypothetical protein
LFFVFCFLFFVFCILFFVFFFFLVFAAGKHRPSTLFCFVSEALALAGVESTVSETLPLACAAYAVRQEPRDGTKSTFAA